MTYVISLNPATGGSRELDREETTRAEVALLCARAASVAL